MTRDFLDALSGDHQNKNAYFSKKWQADMAGGLTLIIIAWPFFCGVLQSGVGGGGAPTTKQERESLRIPLRNPNIQYNICMICAMGMKINKNAGNKNAIDWRKNGGGFPGCLVGGSSK